MKKPICHKDGTVSYWSVYSCVWMRSIAPSAEELAAMSADDRKRVVRHLERKAGR